jgi:hypothetical protein
MSQRSFGLGIGVRVGLALAAAAGARAEVRVAIVAGAQPLRAGQCCLLRVEEHDPPLLTWWQWLQGWWEEPWSWRILEAGRELEGGAGGELRRVGSGHVLFTAPRVGQPRRFVLQASSRQWT